MLGTYAGETEKSLAIASDTLSRVFLSGNSAERALEGLLEQWITAGAIGSGALFVRRGSSWSRLAEKPKGAFPAFDGKKAGGTSNGAVSRCEELRNLLDRTIRSKGTDARGVPVREGRLLGFTLGEAGDEYCRLVMELREETSDDVIELSYRLPANVELALTLFLRALRDREAEDSVVVERHLSRRIFAPVQPAAPVSTAVLDAWRQEFPEIIGRSRKMAEVLDVVRRAAKQDVTVLIHGESGSGKELIAKAIHRLSARRDGPFVSENCAAFPESLLEAEVFGSERGAFTGADRMRPGLLERANHGTLLLDEIGEMGSGMQSKLLRALQEREVRRVGGNETIPVNFRLITATHKILEEEVIKGRFRQDLFFRVQVISIRVPSLRERREDIALLLQFFLRQLAEKHKVATPSIDSTAFAALQNYDWPGNIRELRNEIERALTLSPELITVESLSPRFRPAVLPLSVAKRVREELGADLYGLEKLVLGGVIQEVLTEVGGNKTAAARILGIPKTNLYRRLDRYGIRG